MSLRRWMRCPSCGGEDTGVLAYKKSIVLECYDCGNVEEFELGEDIPVHQMETGEIDNSEN